MEPNTNTSQLDSALKSRNQKKALELLKQYVGNINSQDREFNRSLLHLAASGGCPKVVESLLLKGAAINSIDTLGKTALDYAAGAGHLDVVRELLSKGANINFIDKRGNTALHAAASGGHVEVVKELLEQRADVNAINNSGDTALHSAAFADNITHYVDHTAVIQELLKRAPNIIDVKNKKGNTALMAAAGMCGRIRAVRVLLDKGAAVNIENEDGDRALHLAGSARPGDIEIVKALIEAGAEVSAENNKGKTAYDLAFDKQCLNVIDLLTTHNNLISTPSSHSNSLITSTSSAASSEPKDLAPGTTG